MQFLLNRPINNVAGTVYADNKCLPNTTRSVDSYGIQNIANCMIAERDMSTNGKTIQA